MNQTPSSLTARLAATTALAVSVASGSANALDLERPFLCAPTHAHECIETGCEAQTLAAVNAPRFLRVDLAASRIDLPGPEEPVRHSLIRDQHVLPDGIMLQGMGDGHHGTHNDSGWSLYISTERDHMVLTVTRSNAAFSFFGNCTNL